MMNSSTSQEYDQAVQAADYLAVNHAAYEQLADEYLAKLSLRLHTNEPSADTLAQFLKHGSKILELGAGNGQLAKLLSERGFDVTSIEFSTKMAVIAQRIAPSARIITDEFLAHEFDNETYDGVIGIAFVHLFPAPEALQVMQKVQSLLKPGGINMQATTIHTHTFDEITTKVNFENKVPRFRRHYAQADFERLFIDSGFTIVHKYQSQDGETSRRWIVVVSRKQ